MIAVRIGTTEAASFDTLPAGWVAAPVPLPASPVWDADLGSVRQKTRAELCADARAAKVREIKDEANRRILAVYPLSKQNNLAAAVEVLDGLALYKIGAALGLADVVAVYQPVVDAVGAAFPVNAMETVQAALSAWLALVYPVRTASDQVEADLAALGDDLAAIAAFDVTSPARWPA